MIATNAHSYMNVVPQETGRHALVEDGSQFLFCSTHHNMYATSCSFMTVQEVLQKRATDDIFKQMTDRAAMRMAAQQLPDFIRERVESGIGSH